MGNEYLKKNNLDKKNNILTITTEIENLFFDFIQEIGLTKTRIETIKAFWEISNGQIMFETRLINIAKTLFPKFHGEALKKKKTTVQDRLKQIELFQEKTKLKILKVVEPGEPCRTIDRRQMDYTPKGFEFVILTKLVNENNLNPKNNSHTNFKNLLNRLKENFSADKNK